MPVELNWSPQARTDLLDLYLTIALEHPATAERYLDRIEAKVEMLRDHPRMGVRRADIRAPARMLVETPYLILYAVVPDTDDGPVDAVEIVRLIDGRRDLANQF